MYSVATILVSVPDIIVVSWRGSRGRGCLGSDSHGLEDSGDALSLMFIRKQISQRISVRTYITLLWLWARRRALRGKR